MNGNWQTYIKKINFRSFVLALVMAVMTTTNFAFADNCGTSQCGVEWQKCPPGTRHDISASCLRGLNNQADNCIDTMPVAGNVGRVPEDLCLRDRKNPEHNGMDYAATGGTIVTAAADGKVIETNHCSKGYGLKIVIEHRRSDGKGDSFVSVYAHLSQILVSDGAFVKKGDPIGRVGGTSCSGLKGGTPYKAYGNHLHFEIREQNNGQVINPMCDGIQALCGKCKNDYDPNKCRIDCQKNPNDAKCKSVPYSTPYNATYGGTSSYNTGSSTAAPNNSAVVKAETDGPHLGNAKCNMETYRNTFNACIFCDLFRILFNTASSIAKAAYTSLAGAMVTLVVVGMALWLAISILKFISAFDVKEPRALIKAIFNQAFVVIIVVVILRSDIQAFLDLIMTPIFNTGMALAQLVTSGQSGQTCTGFTMVMEDGGIPSSMGNNILCTIQSVQGKILDIMTLGSTSFCIGFFVESWHGLWFFPSIPYVIVGAILWLTAFMLMVIYPFLLIDSILQLSIAAALLPVAVAAYAFPITRKKYVTKIWEVFMTAMFTFLFLSIVIFIITTGVEQIVGEIFKGRITSAGTSSGYKIIIDAAEGLAWWGVNFLKLVFMMLLGWAVLEQAKEFAGSFSKGGLKIKDIGAPLGGMAMNVATKGALGVGGVAAKGVKQGGKMVGQKIHEKAHAAKVSRMANRALNSSTATTDANGNTTATLRNWYGKQITRTVSKDAAGNAIVTNRKDNKSVTTDKYMTITSKYGKDGKVMQQKVKMEAAVCRKMTNRDGSINLVAIHALRQNATHNQNDVNMAIMQQILKERMPNSEMADMSNSFAARQVVQSGNDNFSIMQTNADGSTSRFSMSINGDRVMTSVENVARNGAAVNYSSDGIINKRSAYNYVNNKVDAESIKNKYAFADYYTKYDSKPMDANGRLSSSIPKNKIMFGQDDLDLMADQIASYGQPRPLSEFSGK